MTPTSRHDQRIVLIAGEASGDLHAARLVRHLLGARPGLRIQGMGARRLREAGADILWDCSDFSAMGVYESLKRVPRLWLVLRRLKAVLRRDPPDLLILIDFGAFNMRILAFARSLGIPTLYYIPPGCWAKEMLDVTRRVAALADYVATPFSWSERLLRQAGGRAEFVGHPILDVLSDRTAPLDIGPGSGPLIAVLPGSRRAEVTHILPLMGQALRIVRQTRSDITPVISCAPTIDRSHLEALAGKHLPDAAITDNTHGLLREAEVGLIASGTATLEAAAFGLPMVVVYAASWVSWIQYWLFLRRRLQYIALPNILAGREIVPERYKGRSLAKLIAEDVLRLVVDPALRDRMKAELASVVGGLGGPGAAQRTAEIALSLLDGAGTRR